MRPRSFSCLTLAGALVVPVLQPAAASPTPSPEPGGANQVKAVEGALRDTLFNGHVRLRAMKLDKPSSSPDEAYPDTASTRWIVFRALGSNGTQKILDFTQFSASIVDKDGISVSAQPDKVRPAGMVANVPSGGAWKETILFEVPKDFKPVKIVLVEPNSRYKAFRIRVADEDVPKP